MISRTPQIVTPLSPLFSLMAGLIVLHCSSSNALAWRAGIERQSINRDGEDQYRAGKDDRGVVIAEHALEVATQKLGPDHPDVATSLNNLAALYRAQGDYAKAEPLYKRALAIREKALGPDHLDVANSLNNLADLFSTQANYAKAEPLCKRALAIREKALGPDHPDVATSLYRLADLYRATDRVNEAKLLENRGIAINAIK